MLNYFKISIIFRVFFLGSICFVSVDSLALNRSYSQKDYSFRWRTCLNLRLSSATTLDCCETIHKTLKDKVQKAPKNTNPLTKKTIGNIAAASVNFVLNDSTLNRNYPVLSTGECEYFDSSQVSFIGGPKKITNYIEKIFPKIGMDPNDPNISKYYDTEFQIIGRLFGDNNFAEIIKTANFDISKLRLIILHIHTMLDPCGICAEVMTRLSYLLNSQPEQFLKDQFHYTSSEQENTLKLKQLCDQLKSHATRFLIEVSSERYT